MKTRYSKVDSDFLEYLLKISIPIQYAEKTKLYHLVMPTKVYETKISSNRF